MTLNERLSAFAKLGIYLNSIDDETWQDILLRTANENPWFIPANTSLAIREYANALTISSLEEWTKKYSFSEANKVVGIVMAGNIPLVGFHDLLSVLVSGHSAMIKLSAKDSTLIKFIIQQLIQIEPRLSDRINIVEQLKNFNAVIATGSDNTARYFHYYFSKYPSIIRKNRTSVAIITGKESDQDLAALGNDVFHYFGLGCRNVSKIFIPESFDLSKLLDQWHSFKDVINHHKYNNNYDYQKSILLVNREEFLDTGFVLIRPSEKLVSPISVVYYERYQDEGDLALKIVEHKDKIQCIVGNTSPANVKFGQAQHPRLWDYADQVDTLKFLEEL